MKAILQTLSGGGSGYGISFWESWMGCEAKAYFQEKARGQKTKAKLPVKKALVTGTVTHGFMELYYKLAMKNIRRALQLNTVAVSFVDDAGDPLDVDEEAKLEGERIFRAYRMQYPPEELGEIVEVEQRYEGKDIEEAVDCSPFTFKPDMVIKVDKFQAKLLFATRRIKIEPGYWLVDHKTDGGREWADQMFMDRVQFTAYMIAWQARYPRRSVKGLLVNVLPKTKVPEFRTVVVPYPNAKRADIMHNFLWQAQQRRKLAFERSLAKANISHCYAYGPCDFISTCDRAA